LRASRHKTMMIAVNKAAGQLRIAGGGRTEPGELPWMSRSNIVPFETMNPRPSV
jgi:hypothetical protein